MDATKLKFKDKYFDKILLSLVLHETKDDLANSIISEAYRVLKDDGEIIITEWEQSKQWLNKILFLPIELLEPKPYKAFIRKDSITKLPKAISKANTPMKIEMISKAGAERTVCPSEREDGQRGERK